MSVRPDINYIPKQDMPPPGGYLKTPLSLSKGARGPKGWQLFLGTSIMVFWGYSRIGYGNKKRSEQRLYERQERYSLAPLLQSEADREYLMRESTLKAQESKIMSEVPGWNTSDSQYYNPFRWTPAHVMDASKSNQKK
eukprot:Nitzschia sp. Nitz4//scaffold196_size54656//14811//15308//NITZ4_006635-RA/size54656-augustus-gene-0.34-mRNA-1//1//CDS//3329540414//6399//frame0